MSNVSRVIRYPVLVDKDMRMCPICESVDTIFYTSKSDEIVGCTQCVREVRGRELEREKLAKEGEQ